MFMSCKFLGRFVVALSLLAIVCGCGSRRPETVPVGGVVTLRGKPVEKAMVMLSPVEPHAGDTPACGVTDHEGRFTLSSTTDAKLGVTPGKYRITLTKKEETGILVDKNGLEGGVAPTGVKITWIIPEKYSNQNTSGLTVEVKPGMTPLNLDVK
jgi:hypothetical protein